MLPKLFIPLSTRFLRGLTCGPQNSILFSVPFSPCRNMSHRQANACCQASKPNNTFTTHVLSTFQTFVRNPSIGDMHCLRQRIEFQAKMQTGWRPTEFRGQRISFKRSFSQLPPSNEHVKADGRLTLGMRLLAAAVLGGGILVFWLSVRSEKDRKQKLERIEQLKKLSLGQGDFSLVDHTGQPRTKKDFLGKWVLIYFGFTHCPDICPDELEKLASVVQLLDQDNTLPTVQPVFITVDPERDNVEAVAKYVTEFHPRLMGLTGIPEKVKEAGKAYRVYSSAGPKDEDNDYIVDHTVIIYLLNPDGLFTDYYNRSKKDIDMVQSIKRHMQTYTSLFS